MAAHELAKVWRSTVGGNTDDGDFDLRNMIDDGDARNCTHSTKALTGLTERVNIQEAPAARFRVRFDEILQPGITLKYRGIAIQNPATNQVNKIVGFKRIVVDPLVANAEAAAAVASKDREVAALLGQEEGTWVGTQP